jgi:hypothetical protein
MIVLSFLLYRIYREEEDYSFINVLRGDVPVNLSDFVLFHQDHNITSDNAYFNFARIAVSYQDKSTFYVIPSSSGADFVRSSSVSGFPALLYFRRGRNIGVHYGSFSSDSIDRFISNWSKPSYLTLSVPDRVSPFQIYDLIADSVYDQRLIIVLFVNESSAFGQAALVLAEELCGCYSFVKITNPNSERSLGLSLDSIAIYRSEDSQKILYRGAPLAREMQTWIQQNSVPAFRLFDYSALFSSDGRSIHSLIVIVNISDGNQVDRVFSKLRNLTGTSPHKRFFYADPSEHRALVQWLNITTTPTFLSLVSNYTTIEYAIVSFNDDISINSLFECHFTLKMIETPPELFGFLQPVNNSSFRAMITQEAFFALFSSEESQSLKNIVIEVASTIAQNGGKIRWTLWDGTDPLPELGENITIDIPSVWYFNATNAEMGPNDFSSLVKWIHSKTPHLFDLDRILSSEP